MSDDVVVEQTASEIADAVENPALPRGGGNETVDDSVDSDIGNDFRPIDSQEALDAIVKARLERANKSAEKKYSKQIDELAAKLKQYEDAQLSADERKDKRLTELEQSLAEATDRYAKLERARTVESLAREMGLPEKFWSRVQGTTDDEIISDINDMLEGLPRAEKPSGIPSQAPKVSVQATNTDPEVEENPKQIVDKLGSFFSF